MNIVDEHDRNKKAFHDIIGCAFDVFNEYIGNKKQISGACAKIFSLS